jgi:hypothetical protein
LPVRLQLRRTKGWRLPADAVNVARPGRWGNPYRVDLFGRELAIALFARSLAGTWSEHDIPSELRDAARAAHASLLARYGTDPAAAVRAALRGRDLACWCKLTEACHADVLLSAANS